MIEIDQLNLAIQNHLEEKLKLEEPKQLYDPIKYILDLGGKRLRPVLTLMTCEFFGTSYTKALNAALAVELFHNFSLIHDDIMDMAPLRRGRETVHHKWDTNTGILSGDAMLILAYQLFEGYEPKMFRDLAKLFSKTAIKVCEGQQYDVDFEKRNDVSIAEYITMIDYKTAVLMGAGMKMGAIVADAPSKSKENIYDFGRNLGIAFQLQDDYLDAFGDSSTFGKQIGGDIIANKKTFLYLTAVELSEKSESDLLQQLFNSHPENPSDKIETVKNIFLSSGASEATQNRIWEYTQQAYSCLDDIDLSAEKKQSFRDFGDRLLNRTV